MLDVTQKLHPNLYMYILDVAPGPQDACSWQRLRFRSVGISDPKNVSNCNPCGDWNPVRRPYPMYITITGR